VVLAFAAASLQPPARLAGLGLALVLAALVLLVAWSARRLCARRCGDNPARQ